MQLTAGGAALSRSTAARVAASPALKGSSTLLLLSLQGIRCVRAPLCFLPADLECCIVGRYLICTPYPEASIDAAGAGAHGGLAGTRRCARGAHAVLPHCPHPGRWGPEERDELTRRKLLLLYYLLRDPLFARHTAPALRRWQGLVGRLPLAGWLTDKVVEVVLGMQQYYSYTAAS